MSLDLVSSLAIGLLYGFSLAAPPGPMNALIASRSLSSYRNGFLTGLGAMTADFLFMLLTYAVYGFILNLPLEPVYFLGGTYMVILAILILRSKVEDRRENRDPIGSLISFLSALTLGLTNPYQILWWLTAGLSFMAIFGLISILGLFLAIAIWISLFPLLIIQGYRYGKGITVLIVKAFSVGTLLIFAILIFYNGFSALLGFNR